MNSPASEQLARRISWFENYTDALSNHPTTSESREEPYRCPCRRYKTLAERGAFEICPVCSWEDDGQDDHDADTIRGGPNGASSLTQARANYKTLGAMEQRFVESVLPRYVTSNSTQETRRRPSNK
ncbi:MAG: hypothetical protein H8F28_22950 [Fibrella sp.]|nr:hypothetical protein [Armatimonadota bacterium]